MPKMVPRKRPIMNAKANRNQDKQHDKEKIEGYRLEQTPAAALVRSLETGFAELNRSVLTEFSIVMQPVSLLLFSPKVFPTTAAEQS